MDALKFLDKTSKPKKQPIYVVAGDEDFLKRRCVHALTAGLLGEADPSLALSSYPGDKADFSSIRGELDTLPFLCDLRLVIVDQADPFVTKFRGLLEKYCEKPSASGILILEVKSWPGNTKLAKLVPSRRRCCAKGLPLTSCPPGVSNGVCRAIRRNCPRMRPSCW